MLGLFVRPVLPQDDKRRHGRACHGEIGRSPVLSGLGVQVRFLRGSFYVERAKPSATEMSRTRDFVQITLARRFTEAEIRELLRGG